MNNNNVCSFANCALNSFKKYTQLFYYDTKVFSNEQFLFSAGPETCMISFLKKKEIDNVNVFCLL